mmetsp:Transcript_24626/g.58151  ORF Transcript_24626/g.58151 Transcript_24626/m.58151 type:complete len:131 (+) Transcript_24626:406-798(+)
MMPADACVSPTNHLIMQHTNVIGSRPSYAGTSGGHSLHVILTRPNGENEFQIDKSEFLIDSFPVGGRGSLSFMDVAGRVVPEIFSKCFDTQGLPKLIKLTQLRKYSTCARNQAKIFWLEELEAVDEAVLV